MNVRSWAAALALALALPGALRAQETEGRRGSGYMGIYFGWTDDGRAEVREVVRGSPADRAGVRSGDVVVRLNGRAPTREAVDELRETLDRGDSVRLRVRHDGSEVERVVVAAERPRTMVYGRGGSPGAVIFPGEGGDRRIVIRMDTIAGHIDSLVVRMDSLRTRLRTRYRGDSIVVHMDTVYRVMRDSLRAAFPRAAREFRTAVPFLAEFGSRSVAGAEFAEMNPGLGRYFHTNEGLLVLTVGPQTPGARGGLQAGDVVIEAAGRKVERVRDLRDAFTRAAGQEVRLTVLRDGRRQQLSVRWEQPELRARYEIERTRARPRASTRP
jgi:S1-C subfamily serine protease